MAVVRITSDLKYHVMRMVGEQFDAAEAKAKAMRPEIGDAIYSHTIGPHLAAMEKLPQEFFASYDTIKVTLTYTDSTPAVCDEWNLSGDLIFPNDLPDSMKLNFSYQITEYGGVRIGLDQDARFASIYEPVTVWQEAVANVVKARIAARHDVDHILNSFTTLAPALKVWPALWDLLPEDVKNKHKEIVRKTKAAPITVNVHTQALGNLTAKLVTQRIAAKKEPQ